MMNTDSKLYDLLVQVAPFVPVCKPELNDEIQAALDRGCIIKSVQSLPDAVHASAQKVVNKHDENMLGCAGDSVSIEQLREALDSWKAEQDELVAACRKLVFANRCEHMVTRLNDDEAEAYEQIKKIVS